MDTVKEMTKKLESLRYHYEVSHLFEDFLELVAITISNSVDRHQYEKREARYMQLIGKYNPKEANLFAELFAMLVMALEEKPEDYLGQLFMELELYNTFKGQFFTPLSVANAMARMTLDEKFDSIMDEKGYVTVNEPTTGGGVTIIALYNEIMRRGYNPQQAMQVVAQDIDSKAVHMTYIQLSLLGINIQVIRGDTLALECREVWKSPGHFLMAGRGIGIKKIIEEVKTPEIEAGEEIAIFQMERVEQLTLF